MGIYTVQQKVITWQGCEVEAESIEQAIELAIEADNWSEVIDVSESVDVFFVEGEAGLGDIYTYGPDGTLEKERI